MKKVDYQIITDFDDQDAYKFTMQYAIIKNYPEAKARYKFFLRSKDVVFPKGFADALREQVDAMKYVKFTPEIEKNFVQKLPWFDTPYIQYLKAYQYNPDAVTIDNPPSGLSIEVDGDWHSEIYWETQILPIASELYFVMTGQKPKFSPAELRKRWTEKFDGFYSLSAKIAEGGGRRRYSKQIHHDVLETFLNTNPLNLTGTSNVMMSRLFDIKAMGTQAHEWFQFHGAKYGPIMATHMALKAWVDTYQGNLGIALTDTFTTDVFYKSFDTLFSKLFDGVRWDSGDPIPFTTKTINHFLGKRIVLPDGLIPKTIVYSDSIKTHKQIEDIQFAAYKKILTSFLIGTWMTNDVGVDPLNMVMKMIAAKPTKELDWMNCVKLSDSTGKYTGDLETIELYKRILGI